MTDAGQIRPDDAMTFRYAVGGSGPRRFPHEVGPRRLPDTLLEVATGGAWRVEDLDAGISLTRVPAGCSWCPASDGT